jgi:hypothetical protein
MMKGGALCVLAMQVLVMERAANVAVSFGSAPHL